MKMEVEIISKGSITPSSPTPPHLRTFKISLLDQFATSMYFPMILYYPNYQNTNVTEDFILQRSTLLKQSLSETLSRFYPFAGKVRDSLSTIECNDEGVCYVEARANIPLSQFLKPPHLPSIHKLLQFFSPFLSPTPESYPVVIQETTFPCGGFTIGLSVSHVLCDGTGAASFLKAWAATACKSSKELFKPYVDAPIVFPQYTPFPVEAALPTFWIPFIKKGKYVTTRLVFNSSAIATLKAKVETDSSLKNPTRVEVITSLLTRCMMALYKDKTDIGKPFVVIHTVNLRGRAVPRLPDCSFGNFIWPSVAICTPKGNELSGLVCRVRESIQKVDSDLVKNLQGEGGFFKLYEAGKEIKDLFASPILPAADGMDFAIYNSWCNFGLYDVDFGWGKPIWTTCMPVSVNNSDIPCMKAVFLMDAGTETGVEAWTTMEEDAIAALEKDKELLQYASINPSPLE